ncbi:MAG: DUF4185 domain-containing protein [bacterium]
MKLNIMVSQEEMSIWFMLVLLVFSAIACSSPHIAYGNSTGRAFAEADRLFHGDPRWLGADGALSVPLSKGRILWLFGDTFVATSNAHVRSESEMVRNTVAIQTGKDPCTASMTFHWRRDNDGSPASFFPESGDQWYWPGHGIQLNEGPLVIFLFAMIGVPGRGLGFATKGYALAVIDNPNRSPELWNLRVVDVTPNAFDAIPATAVIRDSTYVVALAIRQEGTHAGALVRYPVTSLARGDATTAEWWAGESRRWIPSSSLGESTPAVVLDDAGSECSLHWDESTRLFVHVASHGFGASTIGLRTAPVLTGPWSSPRIVYRPPESDGPRPFVYAAKAHPELIGPKPGDLVITYATNSFEFADLLTKEGSRSLYWPRFVAVPIGK